MRCAAVGSATTIAATPSTMKLASATLTAVESAIFREGVVTTVKASLASTAKAPLPAELSIPAAETAIAIESSEAAIPSESIMVEAPEITIPVKPAKTAIEVVEPDESRAAAEPDPESGMHVVEVIPGPSADEHSVDEPVRTPITVGCAIKRIIRVITPSAHRRRIVQAVARAYLHADRNLRLRISCR